VNDLYAVVTAMSECGYYVNNSARAGIVRLIIADRPDLRDVFETRRSKCDPLGAQSTWGAR
jgi:hypothetical protein